MALPPARRLERSLAAVLGAGLVPCLYLQNGLSSGVWAAATLGVATLFLFSYRTIETVAKDCATILFGFLYLPLLLGHLVLLRNLPQGREWIFTIFLIVMLSDTSAYFVGSAIGKHRLYPAISPKKSVEGAIGGLIGGIAGALLAKFFWFPELSWLLGAGIGLTLGAIGQIGDLFESMLKRSYGVKDSGRIIPGHGGLLDRLDSLIFAFPPAYYLVLWIQ
jgi:phosphatidate cytidylyltransferase